MGPLPTDLRKTLENAVIAAREAAEKAAAAAIDVLAVEADKPFASLSDAQRGFRNALRARARALGEGILTQGIRPLEEEIAYEQWHRMLFARFLAENHLLMHPTAGVPVTLEECAELASEEGESDEWMVAAKYASVMLPGIFRTGDPSAEVRFAPNDRQALERVLRDLPSAVFTADDALGWVYQFWQTKAKKEVNDSGRKIGGKDLPAVTQLFTEHYMVRFLLENSLGAWWAARHPDSPLMKEWEYLRCRDDGRPAAGTFPGWPERASEVTVMDPCCGSGHFLVAAADMLRRMRVEEEGLTAAEAAEAVLGGNLYGLELDARCTQLAAFALVFDAWKAGLDPKIHVVPNIACSGIPVSGQMEEWKRLAGGDANLEHTLTQMYHQFKNAPDLGSLVNPAKVPLRDRMFAVDYARVGPILDSALAKSGADPVSAVFGASAGGAAKAAALLSDTYTLVATNPPFLGRRDILENVKTFLDEQYALGKGDLATAFVLRSDAFACPGGTTATVCPTSLLYLGSYKGLRLELSTSRQINVICRLGASAFDAISGEVVNASLLIFSASQPAATSRFCALECTDKRGAAAKSVLLRQGRVELLSQKDQLRNPDGRLLTQTTSAEKLLSDYAVGLQGITTGDNPRWRRQFWEVLTHRSWRFIQGPVATTVPFGGRTDVLRWTNDGRDLAKDPAARVQGLEALGKKGVAVAQMSRQVTLFSGDLFDMSNAVIIPKDQQTLESIWTFCSSPEYAELLNQAEPGIKVNSGSVVKVPFDFDKWKELANDQYPDGLPGPDSQDATQWLFKGNIVGSEAPLQVAVARLVGYQWPDQLAGDLDGLADEDGIVCVPSVAGEKPGPERLRALLTTAYGNGWSASTQDDLLKGAGSAGKALEQWLRDDFFAQHCRLFQNRPFIWQIWDGRRDGFSALINYHKLTHANLQKLTYTYLGWWIDVQRNARDAAEAGADARLAAALELQKKLELILAGEPPYDIYVRWKPLHEQPIGWNPDLDDGVRLNIRPFVEAGVLRSKFTIHWKKDRGANPDGSERLNDDHKSIAEKQEARRKAGRA